VVKELWKDTTSCVVPRYWGLNDPFCCMQILTTEGSLLLHTKQTLIAFQPAGQPPKLSLSKGSWPPRIHGSLGHESAPKPHLEWLMNVSSRQTDKQTEAVLAIRPGRPWPAQTRCGAGHPHDPHVQNSCCPTQNLLGLLTGLPKWKFLEPPLQTDTQTDHATRSIAIGRTAAMRTNNLAALLQCSLKTD